MASTTTSTDPATGVLEPGNPGVARRRRRVQGPDQQLQRRVPGRSGGAVINATYRSGTNDIRGSAWEFNRNTALNATGFFQPTGGSKPTLNRNQFGFVLGGPIVRDHAFFFADYEGFRQEQRTLVFSTIPTVPQRQGVLTVPVVHPLTGENIPRRDVPLPRPSPAACSRAADPNVPSVTASNYQKGVPNQSNYDKWNVRLDHKLNERLSGFVRIGQQKNDAFEAPNIDGPSGSNQNGFINVDSTQVVAGGTWILGRASVLDARLGYSHTDAGKKPPTIGGPGMFELYGIPGLPDDPELTGGLTPQTITGYSQLGRQATNPQFQNPSIFNPRVSLTHVLGRHSLKVGFEYTAINTEVQDTNPLYGLDSYTQPVLAAGRRGGEQSVRTSPTSTSGRARRLPDCQPHRREDAAARHLRLRPGRHPPSRRR